MSSIAQPRLPSQAPESFHPRQPSLRRMPSARDAVSNFKSPLARLEQESRSAKSHAGSSRNASLSSAESEVIAPPVPALQFNLFRPNSIMSIASLASDYTIPQSDEGGEPEADEEEEEAPATPKASTSGQQGYFEGGRATPTSSNATSASKMPSAWSNNTIATTATTVPIKPPLAPKRSFNVSSRPSSPTIESTQKTAPFVLGPVPPRRTQSQVRADALAKDAPAPHRPEETEVGEDWASIHGEQGSDWGDDESQFEWLDTDGAPQATNGIDGRGGVRGLSPSKRLSKLRTAMSKSEYSESGRSGKLKKPLVLPKRAPPPPPPTAPAPLREPLNARLPPSPTKGGWKMTKQNSQPSMHGRQVEGLPNRSDTLRDEARPGVNARWTERPGTSGSPQTSNFPAQQHPMPPLMAPMKVPLKDDGPSTSLGTSSGRQSHHSYQSGYSFYDLDGGETESSPSTPKAGSDSDLVFPKGKYVKVPTSALEVRERTVSKPAARTPTTPAASITGRSADELVHMGIEARGKGDLPKSAYYFMKAAEAGSPTGRMYWGLALRHGWGVSIDDRRAFVELRQACDQSLAEGGLAFHNSPGQMRLTAQQKKHMARDLAMGMFETGNCFLGGVGVKKAPDVALQYLRFAANLGDIAAQEQLGYLLSKGSNGVKKDMKEAAKWYRMAVTQGSKSTVGLSWIWKDKYMV
ncbi:hypothetical protein L202_06016 [Cryptococcus amylolentus CBS 6039]|uniref:Uncharacterized protein n=1 Tax=Cryptococcus amylolentus CBS 6039 TaxID=1295533 RepID=A0A1E3HIW1_9TREE|nr:hypothetical protein L202_06016 [Cryptococcus amylolentus CBS 6039]ODN76075.1 hypothetical protein L202_06016 [Cryptococcus amylolentus CBS 6039]